MKQVLLCWNKGMSLYVYILDYYYRIAQNGMTCFVFLYVRKRVIK